MLTVNKINLLSQVSSAFHVRITIWNLVKQLKWVRVSWHAVERYHLSVTLWGFVTKLMIAQWVSNLFDCCSGIPLFSRALPNVSPHLFQLSCRDGRKPVWYRSAHKKRTTDGLLRCFPPAFMYKPPTTGFIANYASPLRPPSRVPVQVYTPHFTIYNLLAVLSISCSDLVDLKDPIAC